jgi:D-sedoheptulose 7-phosphate isomerase
MRLSASEYLGRLATATASVSVTDAEGAMLNHDEAGERASGMLRAVAQAGKKVMFIGNGGSAGIASHMAVDVWKNGGIKATAFNDPSLLTCISNDYGYEHVFEKPIERFGEPGDLLVAISSSGRSENILRGCDAARTIGASIITLSGFGEQNPLRTRGDLNFYVPAGAYGPVEVIHQALCHLMLDLYMVAEGMLNREDFDGR